jgi:hypothetical protein
MVKQLPGQLPCGCPVEVVLDRLRVKHTNERFEFSEQRFDISRKKRRELAEKYLTVISCAKHDVEYVVPLLLFVLRYKFVILFMPHGLNIGAEVREINAKHRKIIIEKTVLSIISKTRNTFYDGTYQEGWVYVDYWENENFKTHATFIDDIDETMPTIDKTPTTKINFFKACSPVTFVIFRTVFGLILNQGMLINRQRAILCRLKKSLLKMILLTDVNAELPHELNMLLELSYLGDKAEADKVFQLFLNLGEKSIFAPPNPHSDSPEGQFILQLPQPASDYKHAHDYVLKEFADEVLIEAISYATFSRLMEDKSSPLSSTRQINKLALIKWIKITAKDYFLNYFHRDHQELVRKNINEFLASYKPKTYTGTKLQSRGEEWRKASVGDDLFDLATNQDLIEIVKDGVKLFDKVGTGEKMYEHLCGLLRGKPKA